MSRSIQVYTIGFTEKSAEAFFEILIKSGVKRIIDTRLNNRSQLAGFAKRNDLEYFLQKIGGIDYVHVLDLAPTQDILDDYKKKKGDWDGDESCWKLIAGVIELSQADLILVEMKRLGWSKDQGRACLQQTYGKQSRKDLTPTQLAQFLSHLKSCG